MRRLPNLCSLPQDDFELNYDRQEDRETVNFIMNAAFKNHKVKLHKHFKKFGSKDEALQHRPADTFVENWIACCELSSQPSYQDRSRINTNNRAKLKVHHTSGSRPFVWHRKKLQDPEAGTPTAADLYSKTHNKKNGEGWVSDVARKNYEKMMEIQSQSTTESGAPKDVDIFTQVLGTKIWLCERFGRSVKPIAASSSTVSIQRDPELVCELEAAKATIEELKSRQSEYDNLKNQQKEMQEAQRQIQEQLQLLKAQFAQRDS
ncbi:hypothetical protein CJ030_MR6G020128 [Morella rubra]|uniref:Uncharacterized protein n=1 Tax=Morella rubra TaxID=262757 RepID=A0A6A1VB17_9ROSI|nr:hypothetical protein CJ030_MR6G020128 [Morella rubra]